MTEVLYLDLMFLVNLFSDLYLLLFTGLILKESLKEKAGRILLGAAVGAGLGCVLIFIPKLPLFFWGFLELLLPAVCMTRIAFGHAGRTEHLRRVLILCMVAFLTGGIFSASESAWSMTSWSIRRLLPSAAAAGLLVVCGLLVLRQEIQLRNSLYEVTLHYRGKEIRVRALRDTGNRLYEPYGHQPVHILEKRVLLECGEEAADGIYVPFCSVGTEHGILKAVHMDRMEIRQRGREIRILERPWVAVSETPLSPKNQYEMLLHGEVSL